MAFRPVLRPSSAGAALVLLALCIHAQAEVQEQAGYVHSLKPDPLPPFLLDGRAVEISWLAQESLGLREYRLTAIVESGALAGTVGRWRIESGTGEPLAGGRIRAYRVRLPLLIEPGLHVHAALEAVRSDGERRLLAQKSANPRRGGRVTPPAGPRLTSGRGDDAPGLVPSTACSPSQSAVRARVVASSGPRPETDAPCRRRPCQRLRDRGPPLVA
jgi:hypothetical protein